MGGLKAGKRKERGATFSFGIRIGRKLHHIIVGCDGMSFRCYLDGSEKCALCDTMYWDSYMLGNKKLAERLLDLARMKKALGSVDDVKLNSKEPS